MLNLFSMKQAKKDGSTSASRSKLPSACLRVQKDLSELQQAKTYAIEFSDADDLLNFKVFLMPDEGFYKGGRFVFNFAVGNNYPHDPPKVKCETKVYHPNIDHDGNVCLNILREDWKPVLSLKAVIYGLMFLFLEPNPEDPLNKDAAVVMSKNRKQFERNVLKSMQGYALYGNEFDYCLINHNKDIQN